MMPNFSAEQAIIGDILMDSEKVMPEVAMRLSGEEFSASEFKTIFLAAKELFRSNRPVDAVTVLGMVGDEYRQVVVSAAESTPTISNFQQYIGIVEENYRRRKSLETAYLLVSAIEDEPISRCRELTAEIARNLIEQNISAVNSKEGIIRFVETREKPKKYIKTGFRRLDEKTYIDRGDYVVIGGRPSAGKTALTLQIMANMAREHKAVYFSLETSSDKIFDRLISFYTGTPFSEIKQGTIKNWDAITGAYDSFSKLNFEIVEAAGWSVDQIKAYSIQAQAEVIFIDYISLVKSQGNGAYEKVTNISIDLHTMAQQTKVAVIALSQLNRAGDKEPDMTSLRESGQIEQDADCIMLLYSLNPDEQYSDRRLIVAKNKEGATGGITLSFNGQYQEFREIETRYE